MIGEERKESLAVRNDAVDCARTGRIKNGSAKVGEIGERFGKPSGAEIKNDEKEKRNRDPGNGNAKKAQGKIRLEALRLRAAVVCCCEVEAKQTGTGKRKQRRGQAASKAKEEKRKPANRLANQRRSICCCFRRCFVVLSAPADGRRGSSRVGKPDFRAGSSRIER